MSKLLSRFLGLFRFGTQVGVDKAGNRYFTRKEEVDGIMKERRWVIFKGEEESTSLPVEWICWLSGQRKKAPTPEELIELEARRERIRLNVALLKEEEERKIKEGILRPRRSTGKVGPPDLKSFIKQFPGISDHTEAGGSESGADVVDNDDDSDKSRSSEPTGSGNTFQPGTWQPPT